MERREAAAEAEVPLSHGQRALWFLDRLAPGNAAYVVAGAVRVRGGVEPGHLRRALRAVAERHPALRTTFHEQDGAPVQRVHAALEPDFAAFDATAWSEEELGRALSAFAYRGFDLERGPLVRLGLFEHGLTGGPVLVLALHHIVSDFWSLGVLVRELGALYGEAAGGAPPDLPAQDLTYAGWVRAQEEALAGPDGDRLWSWWRDALAGVPQVLDLPVDRPRPVRQGFRGGTVELRLDSKKTRPLARLGREQGATLAMTLLAGFGALLGRWSGQERLLIGMPTTGRRSRELAGLVGYLVNPVAIEVDLRGDPSFGELVERVRDAARGAFDHQDFPLPLLAERLQPERDPSRPPLFQVAAVLQKGRRSGEEGIAALWAGAAGAEVPFGPLTLESVALADPGAQFDLTLALAEWQGELVGRLAVRPRPVRRRHRATAGGPAGKVAGGGGGGSRAAGGGAATARGWGAAAGGGGVERLGGGRGWKSVWVGRWERECRDLGVGAVRGVGGAVAGGAGGGQGKGRGGGPGRSLRR